MNNFNLLVGLLFEPKRVFEEIDRRPRILFPLALLVVVIVGTLFWYYQVVDMEWLKDIALRSGPQSRNMSEEDLAKAEKFLTPTMLTWSSVISAAIILCVIRLLEALYYLLAGKITNVQRDYKRWLSLACWTSLPHVLSIVPAVVVLLTTTTTQFDAAELQPLSLNSLLFHRKLGEPGYNLYTNISLLNIATLYLTVLGVKCWSKRSWLFSSIFVLLPAALGLGIWALIAAVRG
jgi:Yip1 domain